MTTSQGESQGEGLLTNGSDSSDTPISIEPLAQPSQTASDFINTQLQLEAEAREALPFNFDHCTQPLGPLRQNLFSCLTCNPPPSSPSDPYTTAAVCYSCSIACHGEHTLVELFNRRNFVCDCGTTRLPATSPCTLRIDPATGLKGPVHSEEAAPGNTYNQNTRNRFCGCGEWYDVNEEKGTMFQCLGLVGEEGGGCGEDWWHPECITWGAVEGLRRRQEAKDRKNDMPKPTKPEQTENDRETPAEAAGENDNALPPGFPDEDAFDTFICYKCVNAVPWIKRYAGTEGFLSPVLIRETTNSAETNSKSMGTTTPSRAGDTRTTETSATHEVANGTNGVHSHQLLIANGNKRTADAAELDNADSTFSKKAKPESSADPIVSAAYHTTLPSTTSTTFSLFGTESFRDSFCRCKECYPRLRKYPQLMEEEDSYEPPLSEDEDGVGNGTGDSVGSKSLLERGEAALSNVDRVRAIEGVMVYNHLKDKVKSFLQPFAESGQAVGAEDIKTYFEKLRGDEAAIKEAGSGAASGTGGGDGDNRREQSGY